MTLTTAGMQATTGTQATAGMQATAWREANSNRDNRNITASTAEERPITSRMPEIVETS
jgi:hypothetical protein